MVSGLVTSPHDHQVRWPWSASRSRSLESRGPRISSGLAMRIWIKSKLELRGSRTLRKSIMSLFLAVLGGPQRDSQPQGLELFHEHVERLRDARLGKILSFDNRFIDAAAAVHVVRLDGQHFLQHVRRAVGFER